MRPSLLAAVSGALLIAGALALVLLGTDAALAGWLGASVAAVALPAGALTLLMMMRLIPGSWTTALEEPARAATRTWWVGALAFLPVLAGLPRLYPWVDDPPNSGAKPFWLNPLAYAAVTVACFAALGIWGRWMRTGRSMAAAGSGLILLPLILSLAAWLWLMSLDPDFASSGFGLQFYNTQVVIAFCAVLLRRLSRPEPVEAPGTLGALLLTLLLHWAYFQFMSFFITWSGNLPDGVGWYQARGDGFWLVWIAACSLLGAVPLLVLLFAPVRQSPRALRLLAWPVLVGRVGELAWFALPGFGALGIFTFVVAAMGLGALCSAAMSAHVERPA